MRSFWRMMMQTNTLLRARLGTMALFFISGALYASWGLHVPTIKEKFALSDIMLAVALFMVAAGPISIITHIGVWVARAGGRTACTAGGLFVCACLALLVWIPWFALLLPLLVLFGISTGVMDVAVNAEAASVEIALRRPIMSMMHGVFSIGGATGAALGGLALSAGMTPLRHLLLVSAIGAIVALIARPALLPPADTRAAAQPRGSWRGLWLLGSLACVAFIAEDALYDWTTVYMRDSLHTQYGVAGAAYAVFSAGMALGRFFGDPIRARLGNQKCVQLSGVLACIGMSIALVWQTPWAALAGFMLTGLGLANLVPVMFAAAARVQGAHAAESIARGWYGLCWIFVGARADWRDCTYRHLAGRLVSGGHLRGADCGLRPARAARASVGERITEFRILPERYYFESLFAVSMAFI